MDGPIGNSPVAAEREAPKASVVNDLCQDFGGAAPRTRDISGDQSNAFTGDKIFHTTDLTEGSAGDNRVAASTPKAEWQPDKLIVSFREIRHADGSTVII
jgi:hypothetical protein